MKKSGFVKTIAVILSVILLASILLFSAVTVFAAAAGGYTNGYVALYDEVMYSLLYSYAQEVSDAYSRGEDISELYRNCNFYYEITNTYTGEKASNYNFEERVRAAKVSKRYENHQNDAFMDETAETTEIIEIHVYERYEPAPDVAAEEKPWTEYEVVLYEKAEKKDLDFLLVLEFVFEFSYTMRYAAPCVALASLVLFIIVLVFLFSASGHHKGVDSPILNRVDKIPFDIYTAICCAVVLFIATLGMFLFNIVAYNRYMSLNETLIVGGASVIGIFVVCVAIYLVVLGYFLSFSTRIKVGGFIRRTLIFKIVAFVFGVVKKLCKSSLKLFMSIPLVWKSALVFFTITLIEFILLLCNLYEVDNIIFLWIFEKVLLFPAIIGIALLLRKLQKGGEAIAAGSIGEKIDTKNMPLDFGKFGETLNSIGDGLSLAVEERLKSERMKTELITNVSHDIKTPLTSIVNYVSLIKKEDIESEKMREYVEVLDRQSTRLKKLIDDLVEVSKASTGSISVEMEKLDVNVLLEQGLGEYEGKFAEKGLDPIFTMPDTPVYIMADGRRLWRVFDNLLGNICKYALQETRVYVGVERTGDEVLVTFRNISREQLNVSEDELMERFVRGDASRGTEGSGLGLSISRSLTELMGGRLLLSIDGDLFKVVLSFKAEE